MSAGVRERSALRGPEVAFRGSGFASLTIPPAKKAHVVWTPKMTMSIIHYGGDDRQGGQPWRGRVTWRMP